MTSACLCISLLIWCVVCSLSCSQLHRRALVNELVVVHSKYRLLTGGKFLAVRRGFLVPWDSIGGRRNRGPSCAISWDSIRGQRAQKALRRSGAQASERMGQWGQKALTQGVSYWWCCDSHECICDYNQCLWQKTADSFERI